MKSIIFLSIFVLFFSCNSEVEFKKFDDNGNPIVYNKDEYVKLWLKNRSLKIIVIDTSCINQTKKAEEDIKNNNLIYYSSASLEYLEIKKILSKYNVLTKRGINCGGNGLGGFNSFCYSQKMNKAIYSKFGEKFMDSVKNIALINFLKENPNVKYIEDGIDLRKKILKNEN